MARNRSRSRVGSLEEGSTDSKYSKARPNTTTDPMNAVGNSTILRNKRQLNMLDGYPANEEWDKVNPGR